MSFVQTLYVNDTLEVVGNSTLMSNVTIQGDLNVQGNTTSINTTNLSVEDRHIFLNNDYTSDTAVTGGIVVNYDPTTTTDTVAGSGFTAATTVATTGAATFAAGDIIQVSGTVGDITNTGLFEVVSHAANVLTIDSTPTHPFAQSTFIVDSTTGADITKVNVALMQTSASGVWQTSYGSTVSDLTTNQKNILLSGDSVSYDSITLSDETDQLALGTVGVVTISAVSTNDRTYTMPDVGGNADFVMTAGGQTIAGLKTFDPNSAAGGAISILNSTTQTSGNLVAITGDTGQTALNVVTGNVVIADDLTVSSGSIAGVDQTLDPNSASGGALTISNTTTQTSGNLVSITGATGQAALNVPTGNVLIADDLTVSSGTISGVDQSLDPNSASGGALTITNSTTQTSGNLVAITGVSGQTALNVTAGNVVFGGNLSVSNITEEVKAYSGAGPHVLATDGLRVNEVTHTTAASVTLPTAPSAGTKFTVINFLDADNNLTINRGGSDTIDNGSLTSLVLGKKFQRVTLQYVGTNWYIV